MKQIINFALTLLIIGTIACSRQKIVIKNAPLVELDTLVLVPDSLEIVKPQKPDLPEAPIYDEYNGYLPCADCPGISYKLILNKNGTYSETISYADLTGYHGKSENTYLSHGNFTVIEDTVFLEKGEDAIKYFRVHPKGLLLLDDEKGDVEDEFSEKYILKKKSIEMAELSNNKMDLILQEPQSGIDFYAIGTAPDWRLDIDFDSTMSFRSLGTLSELRMPAPAPEKTNDSKIINYYSETETGALDVTIFDEPCVNATTGEKFSYRIRVEAKRGVNSEFKTFNGCGRYMAESLLTGTWQVISINNIDLKEDDFANGLPSLRFDTNKNKVYGSIPCNRFFGFFSLTGNDITFQRLLSTGFPCEKYEFEEMYFELLQSGAFKTYFNEDTLVLKGVGGVGLRLKKGK